MKSLICSIHNRGSLIAALLPRLWFYKNTLWKNFPELWQYRLELPHKDYATFFPYIVSVGGMRLNFKNSRLSWGWPRRTVKDPINIAAYGVDPKEFISLLSQANPLWHQFLGSSYFLYGPCGGGWRASVAVKLDVNKETCERHHIRLFELQTNKGDRVTLGAAHHDLPNHDEQKAPLSWNETRDLVASNLGILCGLSEQVTDINWRNAEGDGKILIINCK